MLFLLAALILLPLLAPAPRAEAFVYLTETGEGLPDASIARANLDGTAVNHGFISFEVPSYHTSAADVAVGASHVYWTYNDWAPDAPHGHYVSAVGRARLDGTRVKPRFVSVPGGDYMGAVALDTQYVYWAWGTAQAAGIGRANLDGSGIDQHFIVGTRPIEDIAVDANHVYWTSENGIGRAKLDGANADPRFIDLNDASGLPVNVETGGASGLAVGTEHLYWTGGYTDIDASGWGSLIGRARLDGTDVERMFIATGAGGLHTPVWGDIEVDGPHIYWTASDYFYQIFRADLDGTDVGLLIPTDTNYPYVRGLAVDGLTDTRAPKTKITMGAPKEIGKTKIKFKFRSSEPNSTFECKLDRKKWKSCESPKTVKHLDHGKHKFQVRAMDAALNVDPSPATDKFKVVG